MEYASVQYAGFWRRAAAHVIDTWLLGLLGYVYIEKILSFRHIESIIWDIDRGLENAKIDLIVFYFTMLALSWAYHAGMESSPLRATLGKLAVGLYVIDDDSSRISFAKASGRFFGKIISASILGIGYMMTGWTASKQALHDIMAGTKVMTK